MLVIDGSFGEGGGQILRTSLALSLVTGTPCRIEKIRAGRKKPGLRRQHLTAAKAAQTIGGARVTGAEPGSSELVFEPGLITPGTYAFEVGTAGSATLVLQTVLPALLQAQRASHLTLSGGTHNPFAPPYDFIAETFLPLVNRLGPSTSAVLHRPGFYPAGGGRFEVHIEPGAERLKPLELLDRGRLLSIRAHAVISALPRHIARRELDTIAQGLALTEEALRLEETKNPRGPGNAVTVTVESEHITETFTGFGQRGVPAEKVARKVVESVREYLAADVPVGRHLADQLVILLALAGAGRFRTLSPTSHTLTNIAVIEQFLDIQLNSRELAPGVFQIELTC